MLYVCLSICVYIYTYLYRRWFFDCFSITNPCRRRSKPCTPAVDIPKPGPEWFHRWDVYPYFLDGWLWWPWPHPIAMADPSLDDKSPAVHCNIAPRSKLDLRRCCDSQPRFMDHQCHGAVEGFYHETLSHDPWHPPQPSNRMFRDDLPGLDLHPFTSLQLLNGGRSHPGAIVNPSQFFPRWWITNA